MTFETATEAVQFDCVSPAVAAAAAAVLTPCSFCVSVFFFASEIAPMVLYLVGFASCNPLNL